MNVQLLDRVKAHILEEPKRFIMGSYMRKGEPGEVSRPFLQDLPREMPACGTVACIAGWALILVRPDLDFASLTNYELEKLAADTLGLPNHQSYKLFNVHSWPDAFYTRWQSADTLEARAQVAADRIDHLKETGE